MTESNRRDIGKRLDAQQAKPPTALALPRELEDFKVAISDVDTYLRSGGSIDLRYEHYATSKQSVVVIINYKNNGSLQRNILKILTRDFYLGVQEFKNLVSFSRHLISLDEPIHCPLPICGGRHYYLMSYVEAPTLETWLGCGPRSDWERVAHLIVTGLQAYHDSVAEVYGECHFRHVFVKHDGSLCFIDCTVPHHFFDDTNLRTYSLMARDIGYWLHDTMSQFAQGAIHRRSGSLAQLQFTRVLFNTAAGRSSLAHGAFLDEVIGTLETLRRITAGGRPLRNLFVTSFARSFVVGWLGKPWR